MNICPRGMLASSAFGFSNIQNWAMPVGRSA
jgi:hypothetical protein